MFYRFDKKRMMMLVGGGSFAGLLLFASGFVLGVAVWAPSRQELAMLKAHRTPSPVVAAAPAGTTPSAPPPPPAPAAAPVPEPSAVPAAPPEPVPTSVRTELPTRSAAPPEPVVASVDPGIDVFSLQVGSFLDAKNARQLQADLKEHGYDASIFTALDSEQREWHAVRIRGYRSIDTAMQALSELAGKVRLQAVVRRSNSL